MISSQIIGLLGLILSAPVSTTGPATQPENATTRTSPALLLSEFIFEHAPFPSCHASTIVQTKQGLVAAWFGGTHERAPDVGIWISRNNGNGWLPVTPVAIGLDDKGQRQPCWNPVLFQPRTGPLFLFYKVGPKPSEWWGMMMSSPDAGVTWTPPVRLPDGILGPIKDKPIQLADGTILSPSSTEDHGSKIHIEFTTDPLGPWTKTDPLNDGQTVKLIQPTLLDHGSGNIQLLCRSHNQKIYQSWSHDFGKTWSPPEPTELPNPNSGIDAVQLADGRSLLVYNNSETERTPLNVAISSDGKTWKSVMVLEDGDAQFSYPAVIQTTDGLVHITWTWKRLRIRHAVLDPRLIP